MITLQPVDSRFELKPRADGYSEFEIHAHLYAALRRHGYDVRGEVKWFDPDLRVQCRFDLVIFTGAKATEIIEVKAAARKWTRTSLEDTRQGRRYRLFGVPVTFIYGMEDANDFLRTRIRGDE